METPDIAYDTAIVAEAKMKAFMWSRLADLFTTLNALAETGHQAIKDKVEIDAQRTGGRR